MMQLLASELCGRGSLLRSLNNLWLSYEGKTNLDLTPLWAFCVCAVQEDEHLLWLKQTTF